MHTNHSPIFSPITKNSRSLPQRNSSITTNTAHENPRHFCGQHVLPNCPRNNTPNTARATDIPSRYSPRFFGIDIHGECTRSAAHWTLLSRTTATHSRASVLSTYRSRRPLPSRSQLGTAGTGSHQVPWVLNLFSFRGILRQELRRVKERFRLSYVHTYIHKPTCMCVFM